MTVGTEELKVQNLEKESPAELTKQDLTQLLEQHRQWLESQGESGKRADLSRVDLAGADLSGINLQRAVLRKTNFAGAELSLADLRGACLMQANLQGANLLGTEFRGTNLQGAILDGAAGLWPGQFGGANLFAATLPKSIAGFLEPQEVGRGSRSVHRLFAFVLLACVFAGTIVFHTTDLELLKNSPALPLPWPRNPVPMLGFYLFAPVALLGLYIYFQYRLQRLWQVLVTLPVIFPDGRTLDQTGPWLVMGLARHHFNWLGEARLPPSLLQRGIPLLLAYWAVPSTLLLFWARYLTRQDLRGTLLHVALFLSATAFAIFSPDLVRRMLRTDRVRPWPNRLRSHGAILLTLGIVLLLVSLGTIYGVPYEGSQSLGPQVTTFRMWAPYALWMVGYNPFPNLTELDISTKPANWTGQEHELSLVRGARLNRLSLRYTQAYRAFLVNAHLWQTNLENANLAEADLYGANLRQADLQSAVLDRTRLTRANLQGANLQRANLARADLRDADVSFASLRDAILVDAKLPGANFYAANLHSARLVRADLKKGDLREAVLEGADLTLADMREAYLWSAKLPQARLVDAQLQRAILIEANLRGADLRGADLQEAILRGAELQGANLKGAKLRGAQGLTADQICSAAQRDGLELDESFEQQVEAQCGTSGKANPRASQH